MKWQPIETAPKDETWILLWFPLGDETKCKIGFWSEQYADWFDSEAASHSITSWGVSPTHWMLLPDAPK